MIKMREKRARIVFLAVILTLLVASLAAVNVEAQGFTLTKDTAALNTCPGSTLLIQTTVTSQSGGTFTVSQEGAASRFSISVPQGFILSAGESKIIFSYVTPPTVTQPGIYDLKMIVSSGGNSKSVEYPVAVEDCRGVSLQIEPQQEICPGEVATYSVVLRNEGRFSEDYSIAVEGQAAEWVTLSDSFIRLAAGEQKEFFAFVTPPLDRTGEFEFTVTAASTSRAFTSASASVRVLPCYNYDLKADKALYQLCEADALAIPLILENKGTVSNTYSLDLDAPGFATLEIDTVTLLPEASTVVTLILNPPFTTEGDFATNVNIISERGRIAKVLPLITRVERCYGTQVEIPVEAISVCNSFSAEQEVFIRNTGKFDSTFALTIEGATFVSLDKGSLSLPAGAEESLVLTLSPPAGTPERSFDIRITATDVVSQASSSDDVRVTTISRETCFLPDITASQQSIEIAKDSAAAVSFTIENRGLREVSYIIELSGNALPFAQVNPSALSLIPAQSETVFLHLAPSVAIAEGNYEIILTARVEDSQISSSESLSINILPQGEVVISPPTPTEKVIERTPLDAVKDLLRRVRDSLRMLFRVEVAEVEEMPEVPEEGEEVEVGEEESEVEKDGEIEEIEEPEEMPAEGISLLDRIRNFFARLREPTSTETVEEESEEVEEQAEEEQEVPEEEGEKEVEGEVEETEEGEELVSKVEEESTPSITGLSIRSFFSNYTYHTVSAIILIIILIIIATGYWKNIVDFFVEEEETNTRTRKNNKKARIRR